MCVTLCVCVCALHVCPLLDLCRHLLRVVIPRTAAQLDACGTGITATEVRNLLKTAGVNMRHLGRVRTGCTTGHVRRVLLEMMAARSIKTQARSEMRTRSGAVVRWCSGAVALCCTCLWWNTSCGPSADAADTHHPTHLRSLESNTPSNPGAPVCVCVCVCVRACDNGCTCLCACL